MVKTKTRTRRKPRRRRPSAGGQPPFINLADIGCTQLETSRKSYPGRLIIDPKTLEPIFFKKDPLDSCHSLTPDRTKTRKKSKAKPRRRRIIMPKGTPANPSPKKQSPKE